MSSSYPSLLFPRISAVVVATLLMLALVPAALGQGAFYIEEEKDGRIYVFNGMKAYAAWKDTGEAVVTGDVTQVDLGPGERSGLNVARQVLDSVEGIAFVDFDERDVIRHELVARIVRAYERQKAPE